MDEARLAFNFEAFAGHFVKGDAADFDGGDHWGRLHLVSYKGGGQFVQLPKRKRGDGKRGSQFPVGIVAVRGFAQLHSAAIHFVVGHELFRKLCGAAKEEDE